MNTSESINELATALCKAQGEMTGAKKGSDNPFFKSKYSDLSQVVEAVTAPFSNNGLSFVQGAEFEDGRISVTTRIMHSSGQWIEATTSLPPTKQDAQGYGSAISYAKRYGLQALAGVPSVDDDGNEAVTHSTGKAVKPKSVTKKQADELESLISQTETDLTRFLGFFSGKAGFEIKTVKDLPADAFDAACKRLRAKLPEAA